MLKIKSNLKINGRHWGLAFVDGIAYTANVALAAKLRQRGYVVTDWPEARDIVSGSEISPTPAPLKQGEYAQLERQPEADQPVAGPIHTKQDPTSTPTSPTQEETKQAIHHPVSLPSDSVSNSGASVSKKRQKSPSPKPPSPAKRR